MSVWDMDSEDSDDMDSDKESDVKDITVQEMEDMDAKDTEEMAAKRGTFCDDIDTRMSCMVAPDGYDEVA